MKLNRALLAATCVSTAVFAQDLTADAGARQVTGVTDAPAPALPPEPLDAGVSVALLPPPPAAADQVVLPDAVAKVLAMFRVYGMLKPTMAVASAATESFSQPNMTAITAAGNPAYANAPDNGRLSFQIGQSRLGVWFGEGTPYRAQLEFDFIDFAKASPTVAAVPRLRIGKIEWAPLTWLTVMAGQDWDLAQPVNPHGINLVGGAFQAGNTGFMRQQFKGLAKAGDFEFGLAVGLQSANVGAKDSLIELSMAPTTALRAQWNVNAKSRIGISALGTSVLLRAGATPVSTFAGEAGVYGDVSPTKDFNVRFEGYYGQNIANLGLLGLGQGRLNATTGEAVNNRELGGFASARGTIAGPVSLYGTFGGAAVLDPTSVVPSYGYAGTIDPANPPAVSTSTLSGTGPGITFNLHSRLGLDVKIWKGLAFMIEGFWYRTHFAQQTIDVGRVKSIGQTFGTEFGFLWAF